MENHGLLVADEIPFIGYLKNTWNEIIDTR